MLNASNKYFAFILIASLTIFQNGTFPQESKWSQYFSAIQIQCLANAGDYIWAGLYRNGVVKLNKHTNEKTYYNSANVPVALSWVQDIIIDKYNNKWIASNGVIKYNDTSWIKYTPQNSGLLSDQIYALAFDSSDNLWIGAYYGGLTKFDGQTWTTFTTNNSKLPSNSVYSIAIDTLQNIWIGTDNGLVVYNGKDMVIYNSSNSGLSFNSINCLQFDNSGVLWIGTRYNTIAGLYSFDGSNWKSYDYSFVGRNQVQTITVDKNNVKWFGNLDGMTSFDDKKWIIYNNSNSDIKSPNVTSIISDENNIKWIASGIIYSSKLRPGGLNSFDNKNWKYYNLSNANIYDDRLTAVSCDSSNNIWIGTLSGDLVKFDGNKWNSLHLPENRDDYNLFAPVIIKSIAIDKAQNVWLSTMEDAIYKIKNYSVSKFSAKTSPLVSNVTSDIFIDKDNQIWIANDRSLVKIDIDGKWQVINHGNSGLPNATINAIDMDLSGFLWLATDSGLVKFKSDSCVVFNDGNSPLPGTSLIAISIDKNDNKWIGTDYWGIIQYDNKIWSIYNANNSLLSSDAIKTIKTDYNNNVWIATLWDFGSGIGGVTKISGDQWETFNIFNSGLSDFEITDIAFDNYGNKWITTDNGGLISYSLGDTLKIDPIQTGIPVRYVLKQNYPNPFNETTTIEYYIPENQTVEIKVFNILGEEIDVLVNELKNAGNHFVFFNATSLPSGIYFYRLRSGDYVQTMKLVLLR